MSPTRTTVPASRRGTAPRRPRTGRSLVAAAGTTLLAAAVAAPAMPAAAAPAPGLEDRFGTELTLTNETYKSSAGPSQITVWDFKDGPSHAKVLWPGQSASWSGTDGDAGGKGRDVRLVVQQGTATSGFAVTSWEYSFDDESDVYFYDDARSADCHAMSTVDHQLATFTDAADSETSVTAQRTSTDGNRAYVSLGYQTGYGQKGTAPLPDRTRVEVHNKTDADFSTLGRRVAPGEKVSTTMRRPTAMAPITQISAHRSDVARPWTLLMGMPDSRVGELRFERMGDRGVSDLAPQSVPERRLVEQHDRYRTYTIDRHSDLDGCVRIVITVTER